MNENFIEHVERVWAGMGSMAHSGLRIGIVVTVAWVVIALLQRAIKVLRIRVASRLDDREAIQRAETLGRVFRYLAAVVVSLIAGTLVLGELGLSVAPILGAAGVAGLAIGFGAQSLVKDYVTGFFLLLENQVRQGDVVTVAGHTGLVEVVTLRYVQLRDYGGHVHFVPNGQITTVTNMTRAFTNAVVDARVAYRENVDEVMHVMREVADELRRDALFGALILDDLDMAGVDRWDESAIVIRCRLKCSPVESWRVRRELLRRLKHAFDAHGIEIPYPHLTMYTGRDKDASSPPRPSRLQPADMQASHEHSMD
jgi:small conductance mechanosensitive channel